MYNPSKQLQTPILLLVFNRLDTTQKVLEAIRQVQPTHLYVASDGARPDRLGENQKVQQVRDYIVSQIDWPCTLKTLFQKENLGCCAAVSKAIDWYFEQESEGIILEDDCLPDSSFFRYMEELLAHYRRDERVMMINGSNFDAPFTTQHSYVFSRHILVWGWATWRRAWQHYDRDMCQWPHLRHHNWLYNIGNHNRHFQSYWKTIFDQTFAQKIDSWAYRWVFSCWVQSGLSIVPNRNLVKNIGFTSEATHTSGTHNWLSDLPLQSIATPLSHPVNVVPNNDLDRWIERYGFRLCLVDRIYAKFKDLFMWRKYISPRQALRRLKDYKSINFPIR